MSLAYGVVSCAVLSSYSDVSGDDNISDLYLSINDVNGIAADMLD